MSGPRGLGLIESFLFSYDEGFDAGRADSFPTEASDLVSFWTDRPLPPVPLESVRNRLCDLVGTAVYWQKPYTDSGILADDATRSLFRRAAEHLCDSRVLDGWEQPLDLEDQWFIDWEDPDDDPNPKSATGSKRTSESDADHDSVVENDPALQQILDEWLASTRFTEARFRLEFARRPYSQLAGEWWSTPPPGLWNSAGTWNEGVPLGLSLVEDSFGWTAGNARKLSIRPDARIFVLNEPDDLKFLCETYTVDVSATYRQNWFAATGRKGRWVVPNWSQVAEDFDGIHLSLAGYIRLSGRPVAADRPDTRIVLDRKSMPTQGNTDEYSCGLIAGWNPDTTYWLTDVVTGVTEEVNWRTDDEPSTEPFGNPDQWRRVGED